MKRLSLILYATWSVLLVLILTFGTSVSSKISKKVSNTVNENNVKLKEVNVELDDYYPIEQTFTLSYTTKPYNDENYGITFTSLDEDIFTVDGKKIKGNRLENDSNTGRLKITSTRYPEYEKIVNITFKKVYPTNFDFTVYPSGNKKGSTFNSYLGVPFFVTLKTEAEKKITELNVDFSYDENYFDVTKVRTNYYRLVPKYESFIPGDVFTEFSTNISFTVNGVKKDLNVTVNPSKNPSSLDDIYFINSKREKIADQENFYIGDHFSFEPILSGSARFDIPYKLSSSNPSVVKIDDLDNIVLVSPGDAVLSYELYNGVKYDKLIHVKNHLSLPKLNVKLDDDGKIAIKAESRKKITFTPTGSFTEYSVTFTSSSITCEDEELESDGTIYLKGNEGSTGKLKVIVDDGFEHLEKEYDVIVLHNDKAPSVVKRVINYFIHKIAGHMAFFVLEGLLGFWCFTNYHFKKEWLNIIAFFYIGSFFALLSEFIQKFMPGRSSRLQDVGIDLIGYIVGYLIALVIYLIIKKVKKKRGAKNEKQSDV